MIRLHDSEHRITDADTGADYRVRVYNPTRALECVTVVFGTSFRVMMHWADAFELMSALQSAAESAVEFDRQAEDTPEK
jgi:hypothetical protein